jgi:hypothetical protein
MVLGNIPEEEIFVPEEFKNEAPPLFWEGFRYGMNNVGW